MKRTIFLVGLMAAIGFGANAQTSPPQTTPNPAVPQSQNSQATVYPYTSQGTYSSLDINKVPQNIQTSFGTEYTRITDASWETNNDVYRSSFVHGGKNMSVLYGQDGKIRETRTSLTMNDLPTSLQTSLNGKNATMPYEIKVGETTYYGAQIGGREQFYDSNGKAVKIPRQRK